MVYSKGKESAIKSEDSSADFYILTLWSLDLFVHGPFQLQGGHTVLQLFRRIELIVHIAISVLPGTHLHQS